MTSAELTPEQAARLRQDIAQRLQYLNRLLNRMQRVSWVPEDPLYCATVRARDAMPDLHVAAHYAGCRSGLGR